MYDEAYATKHQKCNRIVICKSNYYSLKQVFFCSTSVQDRGYAEYVHPREQVVELECKQIH